VRTVTASVKLQRPALGCNLTHLHGGERADCASRSRGTSSQRCRYYTYSAALRLGYETTVVTAARTPRRQEMKHLRAYAMRGELVMASQLEATNCV